MHRAIRKLGMSRQAPGQQVRSSNWLRLTCQARMGNGCTDKLVGPETIASTLPSRGHLRSDSSVTKSTAAGQLHLGQSGPAGREAARRKLPHAFRHRPTSFVLLMIPMMLLPCQPASSARCDCSLRVKTHHVVTVKTTRAPPHSFGAFPLANSTLDLSTEG